MLQEEFVGIGPYLSTTRGIGGKLKAKIEDFEVTEVSIPIMREDTGVYQIALIKLKNWETNRFVHVLAKLLNISKNRITFAGTKDKRAISTQYFCIKDNRVPLKINLKDVEVLDSFYTNHRLNLGDLYGNRFRVRVVGATATSALIDTTLAQLTQGFPNYFGIQRFGSSRPVTHIVGKYIIQRNYEEAVRHYIGVSFEYDKDKQARSYFFNTLDARGTLKLITGHMDYEKLMLSHLLEKPDDYLGAIAVLPRTLKMMFVHGYQSYLFNKILARRLKEHSIFEPVEGDVIIPVKNQHPDPTRGIIVNSLNIGTIKKRIAEKKAWISASLIGYNTKFVQGVESEIEQNLMEEENITREMFKIPALKELSSKGYRRALSANFEEFSYLIENEAVLFCFYLNKGTYATSLLREFMKQKSIYLY